MMKVLKENMSTAYVGTTNLGELIFHVAQNDGNRAEILWDTGDVPKVWWTVTRSCVEAVIRRITGK